MVKFSEKIGMFISDFRIFLTPGKGKFNNFTNEKNFLHNETYAQNDELLPKIASFCFFYLPQGQKFEKTKNPDFENFAFGHDDTIKVSLEIGLSGFFGQVFTLEVIKSTYLLHEKMTSLSNPACQNQGGQFLQPMF